MEVCFPVQVLPSRSRTSIFHFHELFPNTKRDRKTIHVHPISECSERVRAVADQERSQLQYRFTSVSHFGHSHIRTPYGVDEARGDLRLRLTHSVTQS